ncbi:MAG: ComEC/Rec2 family competence protein [Pseudomonadota bacterium]
MRRLPGWIADWAMIENRRAVLWLPVALGLGVWTYFALTEEPPALTALSALVPLALLWRGLARRGGWWAYALCLLWLAFALGFGAAVLHTRLIASPMLDAPLVETVEGRIIEISRARSGAPRVLLDRVRIYGHETALTPTHIRLTLLDLVPAEVPAIGQRLRSYARLFPPGGPVEPGGFDFRRRAFFERLGGVGYVRDAAVLDLGAAPAADVLDRLGLALQRLRARVSDALRTALPGAEGAFAAAIVVGDRSAIDERDADALRAANLAHLLAISGLHMGLLTGLVFAAVRVGLAGVPMLALNLPGKKIAAAAALAAGAGYLALSGTTVATQRAFIMVAVALVAVLLDRPALSLRALAVAAVIVLLLRPISLLDAGFQMSFAATTALIAGYEALGPRLRIWSDLPRLPRIVLLFVLGLVFTSILAGLATAPFAAFHFNRTSVWGLAANLAAVPAMGFWIMPMAILAGLGAPFGLEGWALAGMGHGIGWVLGVAHHVASWPGAMAPVAAAPETVLALVSLGGAWLALWRTRVRLAGLGALLLALVLWHHAPPRPAVLIAPDGRLIGVLGPEGRAMDHPRTQSFAAETWLRRDGDLATQAEAALRPGFTRVPGGLSAPLGHGWRLEVRASSRIETADLMRLCQPNVLLVARHGSYIDGPCHYLGRDGLARAGAVAAWVEAEGVRLITTGTAEHRPWSPKPKPRAAPE